MWTKSALVVSVAAWIMGCNVDSACYTNQPENGGGVGGGPVVVAPTGGLGETPSPKPQNAGDESEEVPCGEEKAYRCTYHYKPSSPVCVTAKKEYACYGHMTVFATSKEKANEKCRSYAGNQGATCDDNCSADDDGRKLYECNGVATCTASGKADTKCEYKEELVLASSTTEAASILVDNCQNITNPGYTCKNKSIKCYDPDSN